MAFEWSDRNWAPTINFFKKRSNWKTIFERAAHAVLPEAVTDAKNLAYSHYRLNTGELGDSVKGEVYIEGDDVFYEITSNHPAAALIEYGGYSPFPPWDTGELTFPEAKAVYENQPFAQPHPFMRPAANNAVAKLNKQIVAEFKSAKP
jgi:hypothetical protein